MKPRILAILPGLIPSTIINVTTPLLDLHCTGQIIARVTLESIVSENDLKWCDLVVLCRNTDPQTGQWFLRLLQYNKPYIYDIDDNFFELSPESIAGKYHAAPERIKMLKEYIRRASLVRVYSEPMVEQTKILNSNIVKVTGPVDWRLLAPPRKSYEKDIVKIVYATSRVNDNLAELFKPALHRVLKKYQNKIQIYFLGYNPSEFRMYPNVFYKSLTLNYEQYLRYFSRAEFDIGLAPLLNDIFHRSKTNLKVREYGACHIAGIYSDVDVYSTTIIQGKTGILIKNDPEEWFRAISELIENRDLRIDIQQQAYQFAQANFSHITFNKFLYQQILEVLRQPISMKQEDYSSVVQLTQSSHPQKSSLSDIHNELGINRIKKALIKLPLVSHSLGFYRMLQEKIPRLISGLKSEGMNYLMRTMKIYIETAWVLSRIRLKLFFSRTASTD